MESFGKVLETKQTADINLWICKAGRKELKEALKMVEGKRGDGKEIGIYEEFIREALREDVENSMRGAFAPVLGIHKLVSVVFPKFVLNCKPLFNIFYVSTLVKYGENYNFSVKNGKIQSKLLFFSRKIEGMYQVCRRLYVEEMRSSFFLIPMKNHKLRLKKNPENINRFLKFCIWEMIRKGRVNTEQRGLWKWNWSCFIRTNRKKQVFPSKKMAILLLKSISIRGSFRYRIIIKSAFSNMKSLPTKKQILRPNPIKLFQKLLEKVKNSHSRLIFFTLTRPVPTSLKPYLQNLSHIFKNFFSKHLEKWKSSLSATQLFESTQVIQICTKSIIFNTISKPIVPFDYFETNKIISKIVLKNLVRVTSSRLKLMWQTWAKGKSINCDHFSSADTTLDLSNFILPKEKIEKLRVLTVKIIQVCKERRNIPGKILSWWTQSAAKRNLTVSNMKFIMQNQMKKKEAQKYAITAFALNCKNQTEFTDIN